MAGWDFFSQIKDDYFRRYLQFIKDYLHGENKLLSKKWEAFKKEPGKNKDYIEWMADVFADDGYHLNEIEQVMFQSFVVSIFIFIEQNLVEYCRHLHRDHNQTFTYQDMKGQGIGKCIHYIEKVLGKKFPFNEGTRGMFDIARTIRNSLVHNEGYIQKELLASLSSKIKEFFPQKNILSLQNSRIVLSYSYAESLINLNETIRTELNRECDSQALPNYIQP